MLVKGKCYRTVWFEDGKTKMINQPLLPYRFEVVEMESYKEVAEAITNMTVRGAPAIGASGAFGLAQAALDFSGDDWDEFLEYMEKTRKHLSGTRPTAYDLLHGMERVEGAIENCSSVEEARGKAVEAAQEYADWSVENCRKIGGYGEKLIEDGYRILTHCNAGWLATVDWGTALAPIYVAQRSGKEVFVFVDETRPRCQGARLTAWELEQEGVEHAVIVDNAAGYYMQKGKIDMVIVGTDRVAANGDVANKIGTYEKAVVAKENGIPFYVAAPSSTVDFDCPSGREIPIEERDRKEVEKARGLAKDGKIREVKITPDGSEVRNPAFDVTPARFVTGFITEEGLIKPRELDKLKK